MQSKAERYSWAAYHLFVLLSALIGDSLVLYASVQRHALKVHQVIVTVIQHIAVSDIAIVIFRVLPRMISFIADTWILGHGLCYVAACTNPIFFYAGTSFIAVLTTSKLLLLKYPLRATHWTKKEAHQICSIFWICSVLYPILVTAIKEDHVGFDYRIYSCRYKTEQWDKIALIPSFIFIFAPAIIVVGTTIPSLKYLALARKTARRAGGIDPWQGTLTVALTAIFYLISILPLLVYYVWTHFLKTETGHFQVYRIAIFLLSINVISNFYIYALTIKSFRTFLQFQVLLRPNPPQSAVLSSYQSRSFQLSSFISRSFQSRLFQPASPSLQEVTTTTTGKH